MLHGICVSNQVTFYYIFCTIRELGKVFGNLLSGAANGMIRHQWNAANIFSTFKFQWDWLKKLLWNRCAYYKLPKRIIVTTKSYHCPCQWPSSISSQQHMIHCLSPSPNFVPYTAPPIHHGNTNWRPWKLLVTKQHSGESSYLGNMTIMLGRWSGINLAGMWHPSQFRPTNGRNSGASLVTVCPCWILLQALSYNRDQWHGCCGRRFA